MTLIDGWFCRLPGDRTGKIYPMVQVDEQTDEQYELYGPIEELKSWIYHDGSLAGRTTALRIARKLADTGTYVRNLPTPGIIAIYTGCRHEIIEQRTLRLVK